MIYLDYAALTPASEDALQVFCDAVRHYPANRILRHGGRTGACFSRSCTDRIRRQLGVHGYEIVYTSAPAKPTTSRSKASAAQYRIMGGTSSPHTWNTRRSTARSRRCKARAMR